MTDTEFKDLQPAAAFLGGRLPESDAGVDSIAKLAIEAAGDFRAETLKAPKGVVGVPPELPVLIRTGDKPEIHSLKAEFDKYRFAPERRIGTSRVTTLQSFIELVNRHKDEHSVIFARTAWPEPKLTAVIDYHQKDYVARFGGHKIEYGFPLTEEFKVWISNNGKLIEQAEFAAFLEDHAAELAAPFDAEKFEYEALFKERIATPIELINLSRSLEIYVGAKIKRQERLQSGERALVFESTHTNANGEPVDIPGVFMISVAAFIDGTPLRIPARLRYRAGSDGVKWAYQLYRWEYWLRTQVQHDLADAGRATTLPTYEGAPEA